MADVVVRQATAEDVPELAELRREFTFEDAPKGERRADYDEAFQELLGAGIRDGSWVVWVAELDGEIVGHTFVAVVPKVPRPVETPRQIGYLTNVYTRAGVRGRGVGAKLLSATTEWARGHGLELLIVWPSELSQTLYHRHGFAATGEPLVWMNPELDAN